MSNQFVLQKLRSRGNLCIRKKKAEESKLHENFKITPPVSSPEDNEKIKPGTSVVVMPPVNTDNVIQMC